MISYFDSHCHLDDEKFDEDRASVVESFYNAGVRLCMTVAVDINSSIKNIKIAEKYPFIYTTCGIHPHQSAEAEGDYIGQISNLLKHEKVKAVGEIGLDYYYDFSPRETQKQVLQRQMDLAFKENLPVVFHVRDAHGDIIDMFKANKNNLPKGVIHCYSGSVESAKIYLDMGFYIAFGGAVTFKNASKLLEVAKYIPLDRLLIETDAPYMTPVPFRGKRNDSSKIIIVAEALAKDRETDLKTIASETYANAKMLFNIYE